MPKIKYLTTDAGPDGVFPAGTVRDVKKTEASALVEAGFAEYIEKKNEKVSGDGPEAGNTADAGAGNTGGSQDAPSA